MYAIALYQVRLMHMQSCSMSSIRDMVRCVPTAFLPSLETGGQKLCCWLLSHLISQLEEFPLTPGLPFSEFWELVKYSSFLLLPQILPTQIRSHGKQLNNKQQ